MQNLGKHKTEILYLIFGLLTTIIYLGSYRVFLLLHIHYILSTNISFILAVLFAFFTNRHYVFGKGNSVLRELAVFTGGRMLTQILNNIGLVILVEGLRMGEFISQVILSIIVTIINYFISKYAVFIERK